MKSTPGFCALSHLGPTVGEILGWDGLQCTRNLDALKAHVRSRYLSLANGNLIMDPIKVFIKREPHKAKKVLEGKYRVISAVSLVDTMVDRIVGQNFLEKFVAEHAELPSAVGWTPLRGGYRLLRQKFPRRALMADKQAWDWTCQEWPIEDVIDVIVRLARLGGADDEWETVFRMRMECLFSKAFYQFPDGSVVQQTTPGIMKSGCLWTICFNSMIQFVLHLNAGGKRGNFWSLGDDTIQDEEEDVQAYLARLQSLGCIVKEYNVTEDYDFAGWQFPSRGLPVPMYEEKHKFLLMHSDPRNKSLWHSYQLMYANEPTMLSDIHRILDHHDASLYQSPGLLRKIWTG